jgi:hypothetical protein
MYDSTPRRFRALLTAVAVGVPLSFAGTALAQSDKASDKAKGDERPETAPGQVKADKQPARPESKGGKDKAAKTKKAKTTKPAKTKATKPANRGQAKKAAPKTSKGNSGVAKGKTTICHATGSETNPYVTITISNAALKAHARHQDGEDIIPAPAAGCPKAPAAASTPGAGKPEADKGQEKVTICHATGSATNPYVKITIAKPAVEAHARHQDGRDIIPAPAGDCPTTPAAVAPAIEKHVAAPGLALAPSCSVPAGQLIAGTTCPPADQRVAALGAPAAAVDNTTVAAQPQGAVLGETAVIPAAAEENAGGVAGETAASNRESGADTVAATSGRLPFTGLDTILLVIAGLALLLGGFALRRTLSTRGTAA